MGGTLSLDRPLVMGILNVTPDSFSDGGRFGRLDLAVAHAERMIDAGVDIIDIGGESTRPGADRVSIEDELERVVPVIQAIADRHDTLISIDTSKPEVMQQAVAAGAGLINDVRALQLPGALEAAASSDVPVCLMHMQGQPQTMQQKPKYQDVLSDVRSFFLRRMEICAGAGIARERIILDPGIGFGKTLEHNLALVANLDFFADLGCPLLLGVSRKSMFGQLLDIAVEDRMPASLSAGLFGLHCGADILRVHDVTETVQAVRVLQALKTARNGHL